MCFTTFSIELYFMLYHVFYVGLYVKRTRAYNCIGVLRYRNNKYYYYYYYYFFMGMVRFESQEYTLQGRLQFFAKLDKIRLF